MSEFTGRTVAEAVEQGLRSLNLPKEEAEIEILDEGHGGVFGLGSKPATVRITPKTTGDSTESATAVEVVKPEVIVSIPVEEQATEVEQEMSLEEVIEYESEDDEVLAICTDFLQGVLDRMGFKSEVEGMKSIADDGRTEYMLNIEGEDLGILIGRRGETLDALQYLVRLVVNQHTHNWPRVEVDVEHYKQRRESSLQRLAENMADRAVKEGRTVTLEAMPPRERRLVHMALSDREDVYTESIGEGETRKVTIVPQ